MIKKYYNFINEEVGLHDIKNISKKYKNCELFFHMDLDGVCSAIAIKYYLKTYYRIETVDVHCIQYGGLEYAVNSAKPENLAVLVDFAHGKPMFNIQLDHHDKQVRSDKTQSTYFKKSKSNAETISKEISYNEIFPPNDIKLISIVDSADFYNNNINPEDIQNAIFSLNKLESSEKNKLIMGFVINRLVLSYKNKKISVKSLTIDKTYTSKNILECLVLDSNPSLYSIFNNLKHYIKKAYVLDRSGELATQEQIMANLTDYIERMKNYQFVEDKYSGDIKEYDPKTNSHIMPIDKKLYKGIYYDDKYKLIIQYGGGDMFKPGSYDRYVAFRNYPDADIKCMAWPMGLIQISYNPFKKIELENIDLVEISKEVLLKHKNILNKFYISLLSIKKEYETSKEWINMKASVGKDYEGCGFKYNDLKTLYEDNLYKKEQNSIVKCDINDDYLKQCMNKVYDDLTKKEESYIGSIKIPIWDIIIKSSGGHKTITNISGLNFLKYNPKALQISYNTTKLTDVIKIISRDYVNNLKSKIDLEKEGKKINYEYSDIELSNNNTIE